jgi:hypothetical protein
MHAGLVEAALTEANKGGIEDLGPTIEGGFNLGISHGPVK